MSDQDINIESNVENIKAEANPEVEEKVNARKKPGPKPRKEQKDQTEETEETSTEAENPIPTVGRIVQYVTASKTVRPAIIVGLSGGTSVEVVVFNSSVGAQFTPNVAHDPEGKTPGSYHWHHES